MPNKSSADKWDKEELTLASIFTAATIIDWGQTRDIVKTNHKEIKYRETNLYLGENPSMGKVDTYMPLAIIASLTAAHYLPKKYRKAFLFGLSLLELNALRNNHSLGLRVKF